jgi:hypothetical protein
MGQSNPIRSAPVTLRPKKHPAAIVLLLSALGCSPSTTATRPVAPGPTDAGADPIGVSAALITAGDLARDAGYLASDALRGRATVDAQMRVTPGIDSAAAYISRRLAQLGVQPAGDNGTYLRHYTLRRLVLDTSRTAGTIRNEPLLYGRDFVASGFNAPGVHEGQVVYVRQGIAIPAKGIDPYRGLDVRGKWVLVHAVPAATRRTYGRYIADFTDVAEEARSRGAAGILTIGTSQQLNAARGRAPQVRDIVPTAGRSYAPYPLPNLMLSESAVARLLEGERVSGADLVRADSTADLPASFALRPATRLRVDIVASETTARPFNVVGIIPGADPGMRNQYVSVASLLDGAVGNRSADGDSIYNAADDNASGSAGNLAIAKALMSAPRARRPIMLVWDSGEETGLWGSRSLAYSTTGDSIVAHFNVDMIGRSNPAGVNATGDDALSGAGEVFIAGPRVLSPHLLAITEGVERDYGFIAFDRQFDVADNQFFYPRTDASPFFERGIPFIEFFTGIHGDYHGLKDEASRLDPAKMEAVSRAAFATIWSVANDPLTPRIENDLPAWLRFITPRR